MWSWKLNDVTKDGLLEAGDYDKVPFVHLTCWKNKIKLGQNHEYMQIAKEIKKYSTSTFKIARAPAWLNFFIIGSNDETCLVVKGKSKNSGL